MGKLNDIWWINEDELEGMMNGETDKVFIIQEKETISYDWAIVGATSKKHAIEMFERGYGTHTFNHDTPNERKVRVFKLDGSHESHHYFTPKVIQSAQFKKCALKLDWTCRGVVDMDENVCWQCLETARSNVAEEVAQ